jgi:hypothetical protein
VSRGGGEEPHEVRERADGGQLAALLQARHRLGGEGRERRGAATVDLKEEKSHRTSGGGVFEGGEKLWGRPRGRQLGLAVAWR